jgi:hypothetical protein
MRLLIALIFVSVHTVTSAQVKAADITSMMIQNKVKALITDILEKQNPDGSWSYSGHDSGATALYLLALSTAGLTEKHPAIQKGVAYLIQHFPDKDVYSIGMYAVALRSIDQRKYKNEIKKAAVWLIKTTHKGTWNYHGSGPGDNSVTQFAILGLKAAKEAGIDVPKRFFNSSARHFVNSQSKDGGWGYTSRSSSSASMTAAGLASLSVCELEHEISLEVLKGPSWCGKYQDDRRITRGIKWLTNYMNRNGASSVFNEPYTAYAVERVGIFYDQKLLGKYDWYREGAATIINNESNFGYYMPHAFKLLFLAKGNTPLLFNKAIWGVTDDWNRRHRDVLHAVKSMSRIFEKEVDWQSVPLNLDDKRFGQAPILYISGLEKFTLTEKEKIALKSFVDNGGTVLISPCLKSKSFTESVSTVLKEIYPGAKFEDIPKTHEIRRMFYDLQSIQLPIKVFMNNCNRKKIFLATQDISLEYEKKAPSKVTQYTTANLIKFALKEKPLVGKLDTVKIIKAAIEKRKVITFKDAVGANASGLDITQVLYGEEAAQTNPESMNNLLGFMRQSLQIPTRRGISLLDLKDLKKLTIQPVLFMTGNKEFKLSAQETGNLSSYLKNGGFLFADSACSCEEFNKSFKDLLKNIFPKAELELIPLDNPVYQAPYKHAVKFSKALKKEKDEKKPFLLGIRVGERYVVIYSPLDFSSALANRMDESSKGIVAPSAHKLATNILSYGLSY